MTAPLDPQLWDQYMHARRMADRWTEEAEKHKAAILERLEDADAETATVNGAPVATWTTVTQTRLDSRKFKAELPDVWERYARPTSFRRFDVTGGAQ